ncbi:hypothetical protein ACH347_30025 [Saccharopolyspora sp. 5N102]|uniref:hypothetical protein n=1 Tax=Saccharopolyspora sp. 5N102 TaxID=3375155 RepID=UPI0037A17139
MTEPVGLHPRTDRTKRGGIEVRPVLPQRNRSGCTGLHHEVRKGLVERRRCRLVPVGGGGAFVLGHGLVASGLRGTQHRLFHLLVCDRGLRAIGPVFPDGGRGRLLSLGDPGEGLAQRKVFVQRGNGLLLLDQPVGEGFRGLGCSGLEPMS